VDAHLAVLIMLLSYVETACCFSLGERKELSGWKLNVMFQLLVLEERGVMFLFWIEPMNE
jgi:hypothetical protein